MTFTFCQSPNADRWHIRKVSRKSQTPALCGKAVKWDLGLPLTFNRLALCCGDCAAIYAVQEDKQ